MSDSVPVRGPVYALVVGSANCRLIDLATVFANSEDAIEKWKIIAIELKVSTEKRVSLSHKINNNYTYVQLFYDVLEAWRGGNKAAQGTLGNLVKVLERHNLNLKQLADDIERAMLNRQNM